MSSAVNLIIYMLPGIIVALMGVVAILVFYIKYGRCTEEIEGTVFSHIWLRPKRSLPEFPMALVKYEVDGKEYQVRHRFADYDYSPRKYAEKSWEVDEDNVLHCYKVARSKKKINPVEDIFPVGAKTKVHYSKKHPRSSYCGTKIKKLRTFGIVFTAIGVLIVILGIIIA